MIACILLLGWPTLALLGLGMLIGTFEMHKALRNAGMKPVRWAGYFFCVLAIAAECTAYAASINLNITIVALLFGTMAAMCHLVFRGKVAVDRLMASIFPMIYPGVFFIAMMELLQLDNRALATAALVMAFFAASINDVFALFAGLLFGKHKLSPELSPKKTIEGSIGGLTFSILFSMAVPALLRLVFAKDAAFIADMAALPPVWAFALLGLLCGGLSQIGDLTASMVKRHCGVKDFGKLLPGHGGIMDRMDGVMFCGAACYLFFNLIGLG